MFERMWAFPNVMTLRVQEGSIITGVLPETPNATSHGDPDIVNGDPKVFIGNPK